MPFDNVNVPESQRTKNLRAAHAIITPPEKWIPFRRYDLATGGRCALGALDGALWAAQEARLAGPQFLSTQLQMATENSPEVELLAKHAKYNPSCYRPAMAVALHNNELGHAATLKMFEDAIAESVELDAIAAMA